MTAYVLCRACQFGRHEDHREVVRAAPEGMFDEWLRDPENRRRWDEALAKRETP